MISIDDCRDGEHAGVREDVEVDGRIASLGNCNWNGGARLVAAKSYRLHRTADVCHERVHAGQGITLRALLGWLKLLRRRSRSPQLVPCRARRPTSITGQGDRRINSSAIGPTRMLQGCSLWWEPNTRRAALSNDRSNSVST